MRLRGRRIGIAALVAGAGCRAATEPAPGLCTAIAVPGITVAVLDSVTGAAVGRPLVTARAGAYADTARRDLPANFVIGLAHERPGTYTVRVAAAGYRPWEQRDVRVLPGECHVRTAALTARLQR